MMLTFLKTIPALAFLIVALASPATTSQSIADTSDPMEMETIVDDGAPILVHPVWCDDQWHCQG